MSSDSRAFEARSLSRDKWNFGKNCHPALFLVVSSHSVVSVVSLTIIDQERYFIRQRICSLFVCLLFVYSTKLGKKKKKTDGGSDGRSEGTCDTSM